MTEKKRCTKLSVHGAHSWTSTYPQKTYVCAGVAEEAQDSNYMSSPFYSAPVTPYYVAETSYNTPEPDRSYCDNSSSSSSSDSYSSSSSSDSGSSYSSSCE